MNSIRGSCSITHVMCMPCKHRPQLGLELFIDEQVDEEVGAVVDVECKSKVAVDRFSKSDDVDERCVRQNENHKQTETDFHCFHVARPGVRVKPEIDNI